MTIWLKENLFTFRSKIIISHKLQDEFSKKDRLTCSILRISVGTQQDQKV